MVNLLVLVLGYRKQIFKFINVINLDINIGDNVHVVGNGQNLPFKNNFFDSVICQAVLEHVEKPNQMSI